MGVHVIKMPDVGEGIAEAELVEWNVAPGDLIREDDIVAAVMTDKATVEIPSPVEGRVLSLGCAIGETLPVGADLIVIETAGDDLGKGRAAAAEAAPSAPSPANSAVAEPARSEAGAASGTRSGSSPGRHVPSSAAGSAGPVRGEGEKPLAAPSVRQRARSAGADLRFVRGTGPSGRITHQDLDAYLSLASAPVSQRQGEKVEAVREIKVLGLRRKIAERMANAHRRIPHITIVEEVDVTAVEELRAALNARRRADQAKLTLLPFLMQSIVKAVSNQPGLNAHFDDEAELIREFAHVHIGVATQTDGGLMVPVVRHCETLSVRDCAGELLRLANAARDGSARREELGGSTITITSLGALGGIATTPIINHPEVAIVGVNRIVVRPSWNGAAFVPRSMMNLSCSFDHRVIDGWDAAVFVQKLKTLLEMPAMLFMEA